MFQKSTGSFSTQTNTDPYNLNQNYQQKSVGIEPSNIIFSNQFKCKQLIKLLTLN